MNYQPFSVAISVYKNDNPLFFDRALESITIKQTVIPNEVVLVVDGPVSNEINQVINKYSSQFNFNVIRLEQNGGLGNALRIATENCSNELIARMDSDDVSLETRFEQQLSFFENDSNLDIVGGDISEFVDCEENIISYRLLPTSDVDLKRYLKKRCPFNHMTVMYKKSSIIKSGGYIDWFYNEDYYLWIRMYQFNCVFKNTGTVLVNVRTGKNQYARRGGRKYFASEKKLQQYLYKHKIISLPNYLFNCFVRFFIQVLLPNKTRGFLLRTFARKHYAK